VPVQRKRSEALSALRVFRAGGGGLRKRRMLRSRLQRQASLLQLREGSEDGGSLATPEIPHACRIFHACHLEAAPPGAPAGMRGGRGAARVFQQVDGRPWFSRSRGAPVHGGAAPGW